MTTKFVAKAHTRNNWEYSTFHKNLSHEDPKDNYALRHIYSLENTKFILSRLGWSLEDIKSGIDHATIDVYEKVVYLHIPNKFFKNDQKIMIKGISRFISKVDYVEALIARCWAKADPYKIQISQDWDEFVTRGNNGDFYEIKMLPQETNCSCHAFSGSKKAFDQDYVAAKILINDDICQGQIPDKHIFALWKYLGADNQSQYEYCYMERKFQATKPKNSDFDPWEFDPEEPDIDPYYFDE